MNPSSDIYFIKDQFVPASEARVSATDLSVLRGYGVFDFTVTYNRRPFFLDEHLERLANSARKIGMDLSRTPEEIRAIVEAVMEKNPHQAEAGIRILHTGGVSPDGITPAGNGILMVMATRRQPLPADWYLDGVKITTTDSERFIPGAKSLNYLAGIVALNRAAKAGAIEAVYRDREGNALEGTTSNIFGIKGSRIVTPEDGILPGITRGVVLDLLPRLPKDLALTLELRPLPYEELLEMDEVFLTASNKEVMPVVTVDDHTIGSGSPGPGTIGIMALFADFTRQYGLER